VADKNAVFDRYSSANERVARDFAASANHRSPLDFDKSSNLAVIPYRASVKIHQIGLMDDYTIAE